MLGLGLEDADTCWAGIMESGALLPTPSTHLLLGLKMKKALASGMGTAFSFRCSERGAWAGAHGHLGLLPRPLLLQEKSTVLNSSMAPTYFYHHAAHFQTPSYGQESDIIGISGNAGTN